MAEPGTPTSLPGALPVVGHLPWLRWRPLTFLTRQRAHGPVTACTLRGQPAYLVNEPDLVWRLLTEYQHKVGRGTSGDKTRALTGNGLGSVDGEFHRRQRRLIQPVFHRTEVASRVPLLREAATAQAARWRQGERIDLPRQMLVISAAGVLTSLFGVIAPDRMAARLSTALPACLDIAARRAFASVRLLTKRPTTARRYSAALAQVHAVAAAIGGTGTGPAGEERTDLLGRLRKAQRDRTPGVDDQQVRDEIMTMLVAGVETSATTLSWTFHLLARDPGSEQRLCEELDRVLRGRPVTAEDLPRLEFLQYVVNESLRLFPPVWLVRRRATTGFQLGQHDIQEGASVYFSPYALHRDPRWFRDPERFDPLRWAPERRQTLPRGAYLPFGAGVHRCVGEAFGVAEVMVVLATLLPQWRLRPVSPTVRPRAVVTLRPGRMRVTVRSRRLTTTGR